MINKITKNIQNSLTHDGTNSQLNWLRAAVLGANDGIVSISGLVVGVASATNSNQTILAAGIAGLLAGSLSMAAGEYVSVSTQRDTEKAILDRERQKLHDSPEEELAELAAIYETKGVSSATARQVAKEMSEHDVFAAHAYAEHGIDPHDLTNPWHAAIASAVSFVFGAMVPLCAILLPPDYLRILVTYVAVVIALAATGTLSARFGRASARRASLRVVTGGLIAMTVTYFIGQLFHVSGV